jgi:hypothetical protein
VLPEQKYVDGLYSFPPQTGFVEDELGGGGGGIYVLLLLSGGGGGICALLLLSGGGVYMLLLESSDNGSSRLSPPPEGESLEQAKSINPVAKIAIKKTGWVIFINTSFEKF